MKKFLKWLFAIFCIFIVLVVAAILIIPRVIDVQKYKPRIEALVAEKTNRPFSLKGDIDLSLFPWVGVGLSDLHLGNPQGFSQKDMLTIRRFEVRVKVMPLLSRQIEVKTFMVDEPVIYLEKLKNGTANWEGIGPTEKKADAASKKEETKEKKSTASDQGLPIESLVVGTFGVTSGQFTFWDQTRNKKNEIKDLEFVLKDISLDKPVKLLFKALADGKPVSLEGSIGPVGKDPGKGTISFDMAVKALGELAVNIKGDIKQPAVNPEFDLAVTLNPFSPRKLMAALEIDFPVETSDPGVLDKVGASFRVKGNPSAVELSNGKMTMDDSTVTFDLAAREFNKPDIKFNILMDRINLDRYLPPASQKTDQGDKEDTPQKTDPVSPDYTPLRKLVMDGQVRVKTLEARQMAMDDIRIKVTAKDGVINMDPFSLRIAEGVMNTTVRVDVSKKSPKTAVGLKMAGIQAAPLIQALAQKDIIEGTLKTQVNMGMTGDTPDMIKKTLNGSGSMVFNDGAVVGVDLTNIMSTIKSKMGTQDPTDKKPRTDFAEFNIPFDIKNGVFDTRNTSLVSPLLRVLAQGKADLVQSTLDFKITPKVVGTLKGQGDQKDRSGLMVPVNVTGTFTAPKFRPDVKGILDQDLPDASQIKEVLKDQGGHKKVLDDVKQDPQSLIQGLIPIQ